jgi:transcriptional regulator GlxA family with amidase domain
MRENRHIGFLIVTNFSMVGFLCALSVFRNANLVIGREFYETNVLAETVEPVTASVGISVAPDHALSSEVIPDLVFVCAGTDPQSRYSERIGGWLRRIAQRGTVMGAISTGADLLARAGLLKGYRCTIYWEQAAAFAEEFPDTELTDRIYEIDRNRLTCGGATSSIDLCLNLVAADLGPEVAATVSSTFILDRIREAEEPQKHAPALGAAIVPKSLGRAISLMEAHIEDPLAVNDIAAQVGLGGRHLRRLFQQRLHTSPGNYYLRVRLTRARQLVLQTRLKMQNIASACGFSSASGFASAYRKHFARTPMDDRLR